MNSIVIVAGGKGLRMGSDIPKQFLLLKNKPVLMHTIQRFNAWDHQCEIILVLPADQHEYWKNLCLQHQFDIPVTVTNGGATRFHSVQNGIEKANGSLIGIHDGVRPLVSNQTIDNCFAGAALKGNAIPCLGINDSLRKKEGDTNFMVDRSQFFQIQTPQVFQADLITSAFTQDFSEEFTDDASVIEKAGHQVFLVDGNEENIKITRPTDLKIAEIFI